VRECSLAAMGSYFSRRPCSLEAPGASLGERCRRGGKRELGCGLADDAISIMTCRSVIAFQASRVLEDRCNLSHAAN
jgi:hypothetical protein